VDQVDAACLQHTYPHKLINWKHAIFFWLVEATIHNCTVMWNHLHPGEKEESLRTFRRALADELRQAGQNLPSPHHSLVCLPKEKVGLKCAACRARGVNSSATYYCPVCNIVLHQKCYPALHPRQLTSQGRKRKRTSTSDADGDEDTLQTNAEEALRYLGLRLSVLPFIS
jgi:hypothetical protein